MKVKSFFVGILFISLSLSLTGCSGAKNQGAGPINSPKHQTEDNQEEIDEDFLEDVDDLESYEEWAEEQKESDDHQEIEAIIDESFVIRDEIKNASVNDGIFQVGNDLYYLGSTLGSFEDSGSISIVTNEYPTGYESQGSQTLAYMGTPLLRVHCKNDSFLIPDCTVYSVGFGVEYDADLGEENAEYWLSVDCPVAIAPGIYIGQDYNEMVGILGEDSLDTLNWSHQNVYSFIYYGSAVQMVIIVDRYTGKVCGIMCDLI